MKWFLRWNKFGTYFRIYWFEIKGELSLNHVKAKKKLLQWVCWRRWLRRNWSMIFIKNCLLNTTTTREFQKRIQSENHQLCTIETNKIALSPFDDKRYILKNGVTSYAYGHCLIPITEKEKRWKKTCDVWIWRIMYEWKKCLWVKEEMNVRMKDCEN